MCEYIIFNVLVLAPLAVATLPSFPELHLAPIFLPARGGKLPPPPLITLNLSLLDVVLAVDPYGEVGCENVNLF